MASWSSLVALSGFSYDGINAAVVATPRLPHREFQCFWATGTGWGTFSFAQASTNSTQFVLSVLSGELRCQSCEIKATDTASSVQLEAKSLPHTMDRKADRLVVSLTAPVTIHTEETLKIEVHS
jgi:hypothetical protein